MWRAATSGKSCQSIWGQMSEIIPAPCHRRYSATGLAPRGTAIDHRAQRGLVVAGEDAIKFVDGEAWLPALDGAILAASLAARPDHDQHEMDTHACTTTRPATDQPARTAAHACVTTDRRGHGRVDHLAPTRARLADDHLGRLRPPVRQYGRPCCRRDRAGIRERAGQREHAREQRKRPVAFRWQSTILGTALSC